MPKKLQPRYAPDGKTLQGIFPDAPDETPRRSIVFGADADGDADEDGMPYVGKLMSRAALAERLRQSGAVEDNEIERLTSDQSSAYWNEKDPDHKAAVERVAARLLAQDDAE